MISASLLGLKLCADRGPTRNSQFAMCHVITVINMFCSNLQADKMRPKNVQFINCNPIKCRFMGYSDSIKRKIDNVFAYI